MAPATHMGGNGLCIYCVISKQYKPPEKGSARSVAQAPNGIIA